MEDESDSSKAYDFVHRTDRWTAIICFCAPPEIVISVIRLFYDGMVEGIQNHDGVCSGCFAMKQGLGQRCVLTPLLFSVSFAAFINVVYTRFKADKDIVDALVHFNKKIKWRGGPGELTTGALALATSLWDMLYAEDYVVSQSPEKLRM